MLKNADEEKLGAISGLKGSPALLCFVSLAIIFVIPIAVKLLYSVDSPNVIKTPWSAGGDARVLRNDGRGLHRLARYRLRRF